MRRRRVLALAAGAVGIAGCTGNDPGRSTSSPTGTVDRTPTATERTPLASGTTSIGGSLNGRPDRLEDDPGLVVTSETTWLHAFLDVRGKYDRDVTPWDDPDVTALRRATRETDVRLVVSLLWDFIGLFGGKPAKNVPEPGSSRERALFEYATELLAAIGRPADIVVLGNEPVWETLDEDVQGSDQPLLPFTRDLKDHLVEDDAVGDPRLLLGAINRIYNDYVWNEYRDFYERLLAMARTDDDVDGIDLHVHYAGIDQAETMLDMVREEFPDGTVTATEFSPVWRYHHHIDELVAEFEGAGQFVDRYGISGDTTVAEYLEAAKDDLLSRREIADFMEAMPWYNVDFVEDMYQLLGKYDVEVGTIGFLADDVRHVDWTGRWAPFEINCLFQPALIDSEDGVHPHYLDDYRDRA